MKKIVLSTVVILSAIALLALFFPAANLRSGHTHPAETPVVAKVQTSHMPSTETQVSEQVKHCPTFTCKCALIPDGGGGYHCPCCGKTW